MLKTTIPFVDLRGKTPVDLLRTYPDKARRVITDAPRAFGLIARIASAVVLPLADRAARNWLRRNGNPYLHEIESMHEILGTSGLMALNLSYEWGCSSGAWRTGETVSMLRVLDWPFPGLGREAMVVLQQGKAGDFYNVTWSGISGMFTGMKPGAFSAALNMAPMRRHGLPYALDWIKNRLLIKKERALPPAHLLRQVFETAKTYKQAREMLTATPVAAPVIFTLAGIKSGDGCVIERLENTAHVFELSAEMCVAAANHFISDFSSAGKGWRERQTDSPGRYGQCAAITGYELEEPDFGWLRAPIINSFTRLCVVADAATGRLMVQGYEGSLPATAIFNLPPARAEQTPARDAAWN